MIKNEKMQKIESNLKPITCIHGESEQVTSPSSGIISIQIRTMKSLNIQNYCDNDRRQQLDLFKSKRTT